MTLSVINHKQTQSFNRDGVIYWANPKTSAVINSLGEVYNRPFEKQPDVVSPYGGVCTLKTLKKAEPHTTGNYSVYATVHYKKVSCVCRFNSLFAAMVLGVSLRGKTLKKIDETGEFLPENLKIVSVSSLRFGKSDYAQVGVDPLKVPEEEQKPKVEEVKDTSQTYLTKHTSESKFITEDFAEFPTLDLANWHQSNIDKGKANAEIVMKYNGGWACAEEVYLQSVSYRDGKPYEHFRYVMENDNGVQEVNGESTYSFNDMPYLGILGEVDKAELLQKRFKKEDADLLFDTIQSANVLVRKAVEVSKRGI